MHPFGIYLAAADFERNHGTPGGRSRKPQYASVDALPLNEPESISRRGRLTSFLRRRLASVASA